MIIILRSNDLSPDPRVAKYTEFFEKACIKYLCVGWNRGNSELKKENTVFFNKISNYGAGYGNMLNLLLWNIFLLWTLIKERASYKTIHACDFDTVLPAVAVKLVLKKKLIFDVFDWYSDSRSIDNKFLLWIISRLEKFSLRKADSVIICEPEREKQLPFKPKRLMVLPNIPVFTPEPEVKLVPAELSIIRICYVGILEEYRCLSELLEVVAESNYLFLDIAGFGVLEEECWQYSKRYNNICFHGKVNYCNALRIMNNSDIIYAMYSTKNRNNIFAAPNKFYEALMLGKPIITTKDTLVGEKTESLQVGFVIGEGKEDLLNILKTDSLKGDIKTFSDNAVRIWSNTYKGYVENFLNTEYKREVT